MIVNLVETFSLRLKQLMDTEAISARKLAKDADISRRSIGVYLQGLYPPRYDSLAKIADFFEVSADYLLGLEKEYFDRYKTVCKIYEIPEIFISRLKQLLKENNISQCELGRRMKIEQGTISKWVRMKNTPEIDSLVALAKIFDCKVDYFLCREKLIDS